MTTASTIKALLRRQHNPREWALAFEVANGTGGNASRSADAVAMNLWPSRGLAIHGFEIKVSRGDWKRELQNPKKAEAVAQYCDYWWIVAPEGVVSADELPEAWGLQEVRSDALVVVKQATKAEAVAVTRSFMAALFRRMSETDGEEVEKLVRLRFEQVDADRRAEIERAVSSRTQQYETLRKRVEEFERAAGLDLEDWQFQPEDFGKAVKFVLDNKLYGAYHSIERLREQLRGVVVEMDKVAACHRDGTPYVPDTPVIKRRRTR
ncbi:hypothetical protein [Xanthomonas oryzae]|uniref:hypothetical protein n=1 Tax=Xanthomonas oryzae TaxID=347 RepID=UPI003DA1A98E